VENTLIFLKQLLNTTTGIPLSVLPLQKSALLEFLQDTTEHIFDAFLQKNFGHWHRLLLSSEQGNTLCEIYMPGGVTFLVYAHIPENCIYCFGPVIAQSFTAENSSHLLTSLPIVERHILHSTSELVIGYITGKQQTLKILHNEVSPSADTDFIHHTLPANDNIVQMRQVELRYEYSAALTDAIQQGNISLATHLISQYDPNLQTTVRNTNPLRNAQNYCIVLNTQLRHALEKSGIHPYQVDKLSNEIGIEIEQLKSTAQLPEFFSSIIRRYCRLVQEHAFPNLKPLTNLAVTYIKEHLADNLTVKDTAKALTVNANYLSTLFHRDMGMTFIDFVNKERTRQAAALLRHTNLQIQQIASTVGYNNTSYFAKQFVRFQGVSPSSYRREI